MKSMLSFLTAFALVGCFAFPTLAQEGEAGKIDWANGYIISYGYGTAKPSLNKPRARISSIRAAKIEAMRNLLETVKGISIDSRTLVRDFMVERDVISARVEGEGDG